MNRYANVNDRETVKAIYSLADYENDSRQNSSPETTIFLGLLIENYPNEKGLFPLRRKVRGRSEESADSGGVFVCPYLGMNSPTFYLVGGNKGAVLEAGDIFSDEHKDNYEVFIDVVIKTANEIPRIEPMDPFRLANFQ